MTIKQIVADHIRGYPGNKFKRIQDLWIYDKNGEVLSRKQMKRALKEIPFVEVNGDMYRLKGRKAN
jgi:hypothetical protein